VITSLASYRHVRKLLTTCVVALCLAGCARTPSGLAIGAPAPAFSLPGTDGKTHTLNDYSTSPVLVVVFTCNSCPASQLYESRVQRLYDDYRDKGVALVAINPNRPGAFAAADLGYSEVGESLDEMKTRTSHRRLTYPYLSAGDAATVVGEYKVKATPEVFVFDQARTLRYRGRIDDNVREDRVAIRDARNAIDALLATKPVPSAATEVAGCPIRTTAAPPAVAAGPVTVEAIGADQLKKLRQNGTGKLLLINFWATWCAPCVAEFPDLEQTYRMYKARNVEFVTVSVNDPGERAAVIEFLQKNDAAHLNYQFGTADVYGLQAAFDPNMPAPVPFTLLLAQNGDVLYQELGGSDIYKLRRAILASLPEDPKYPGQHAYWSGTP
jgi:thiol-disulfide isomerase/thioredoxin